MRRSAVAALLVSVLSVHFATNGAAPATAAGGDFYHLIAPTYVRPGPGNSGVLEAGVELTVALPPEVPPTATAVVAMVQYGDNNTQGRSSLLLATDCTRPADPATDGVARIRPEDSGQLGPGVQHQAVLPASAGSTCLTSELGSDVWLLLVGYVDSDPSGYAYVDQPDTVLFDGQIPNAGLRLTGVPVGRPYALWLTLDIVPDAQVPTEAYLLVGECGPPNGQPVLGTGLGGGAPETIFGSAILMPPLSDPCLFSSDADSSVRVELAGTYVAGGTPSPLGPPQIRFRGGYLPGFTAIDPTRVLDTRDPSRAPDPEAVPGAPVAAGDAYRLDLGAVVPLGTTAVALNVTVTEPVGAGFVTVYPCEASLPLASNLNYTAGLTVPNAVTAALGGSREVCLYASATAHLIVDLSGWYRSGEGDGYEPSATPTRAFDTRAVGPRRPAASTWEADLSALVPSDATAVVMNVTVTEPAFAGFVTVYPCGGAVPTVSNLNFGRGVTVANLVTVRLPADKRVCFYTQVPAHLVADVSGSYRRSAHAGLVAFTPTRLFDTREESTTRPATGSTAYFQFTRDVVAWIMNVTVTEPVAGGFLTAWNCGLPRPEASNVNYAAGQTVPNLVVAAPVAGAAARMICFYVHAATHYLADVTGYFSAERFIVAYVAPGSDSG